MASNETRKQTYDNLLKQLVEHQAASILPLLLDDPDLRILGEQNIELLIPPRRSDRVYRAFSKGEEISLDIEFESVLSGKMDVRMLIYHALVLEKYERPVTSLLVYPFETNVPRSPFIEWHGGKETLSFHYVVLPLGTLNARKYVDKQAVPIYGLLPAMGEISDELLLQAIDEMIEYYGENDARLREELLCFRVLLARAQRLPEGQLTRVLRRVRMFDPLLEDDPWVKERIAEGMARGEAKGMAIGEAKGLAIGKAEGKEEGRTEGELKALRSILHSNLSRRFPALAELAKAKVVQIKQPEELNALVEQILLTSDEQRIRALLSAY